MNQLNSTRERLMLTDHDRDVARPASSFTMGDVFSAARHSPFLIVLLTAMAGGGAFVAAKNMPLTYSATAKLISDAARAGIVAESDTQAQFTPQDSATATIVETVDTPIALDHAYDALSPDMQARLAATFEFPPEAAGDDVMQRALLIQHISSNLDVAHSGRSYVIDISYSSESPELSAAVSNAVAQGYLTSRSDLRVNVYRQMLENLDREIEELTASLRDAERRAQMTREEGKLLSMRFGALTGQRQDEAIEVSADTYAQQREAEREVDATGAVYERLLLEHRQVQSRIGAPELTVQLFAPAIVPLEPAGFNAKPVILALGLMAGFLVGLSLAILRNGRRQRRAGRV
ncbi:hypothetical protein PANO111632_15230 [Paracoccus nototheniae]|uniref:Polysaccharide chain length determinant N-terminal domain-containing protein n=1 Tax=Paracoccus nototheniae TaxID=2489002 RepID=A0ABW4E0K7_9RHOB|nr:hypothetical protein [Paracoccus nototheniae]